MSGIYIKGMEMPESCRDCAFETYYFSCGETKCRATWKTLATNFKAIPFDGRANDCPLVAVPKHGDLIDRDMVLEKAWDVETFVDAVKYAPTIFPAEEGE